LTGSNLKTIRKEKGTTEKVGEIKGMENSQDWGQKTTKRGAGEKGQSKRKTQKWGTSVEAEAQPTLHLGGVMPG